MAENRWQGCKEALQSMQLSVFGVCLMVGLIVSAAILASTAMAFRKYPDQVVGVTGAAAQRIVSVRGAGGTGGHFHFPRLAV